MHCFAPLKQTLERKRDGIQRAPIAESALGLNESCNRGRVVWFQSEGGRIALGRLLPLLQCAVAVTKPSIGRGRRFQAYRSLDGFYGLGISTSKFACNAKVEEHSG